MLKQLPKQRSRLNKLGLSAQQALAASAPHLPGAATVAAVLLAYVGLEWVSFIHEHKGVPVTPWNPGLGVAFALLVLKGPRYGLVLFTGVVIAEIFVLHTQLAWPVIIAMAAIIAVSFTGAAALARHYFRLNVSLAHVRDVLVLLATGAAGAAVSAGLLTLLLLATDELGTGDLGQASVPLLVGDIIGIAVMTPLALRLSVRWRDMTPQMLVSLLPELTLFAAVIGLALWMIVGAGGMDHKFFSLLFLPVVAAAVRHGIDGSCVSLAATQLGLVGLLGLYGHDTAAFTEFQIVMLALTMSGLLVGVVVSERRRADEAARQAELRLKAMQGEAARAARMNLVSGMASALAHEINQPMTATRALARTVQQLLRAPEKDMERVETNLANLVAQIDHAASVVRRMREFLRRGQPHFSTLDIRAALDDALALARPDAAAHRIAIDLDMDEALPPILGDRIQLQQVVLNLVHNAVESITETQRADGRILVAARRAAAEPGVEISVADNGVGLGPDLQLFEPLSSSKKDGLGLGLSISASIVQAHGGRIWLQSGKAGATEFRFFLPLQAGRAA